MVFISHQFKEDGANRDTHLHYGLCSEMIDVHHLQWSGVKVKSISHRGVKCFAIISRNCPGLVLKQVYCGIKRVQSWAELVCLYQPWTDHTASCLASHPEPVNDLKTSNISEKPLRFKFRYLRTWADINRQLILPNTIHAAVCLC